MTTTEPIIILSQAPGYGVLVGLGSLFAIGMILITKALSRYLHEDANSTENFMVSNRSINKWFMANSAYSSWSWANELLFVSTNVYLYGVQCSLYYSMGLCIQLAAMNLIGVHSKKKVPTAHTSLEIIEIRYGKITHIVFIFFCLATNLLSSCYMILSAASAISIIAGNLHIVAATLLIPVGVLIYTTFSGLKGTFITDFAHTLVLLIVLCYINTAVLSSEKVGGLNNLWTRVTEAAKDKYIEGNYKGSFLTGKSHDGIIFALVLTMGNFGLTISDSSFWQKSFSARPEATFPGYLTASIAILSNAWSIGAILGSATLFLENDPSFPTYPRKMTEYEIASGFPLPYIVKATLGKHAVGGLLLIIYLSVTSTVSAQMISVSSIISYDIYKKYVKPKANNKQVIRISHLSVVAFGFFAAGFSIMLHYVGITMTFMGYFISNVICVAVFPLALSILWDRQTRLAATVSPIIGMIAAFIVWVLVSRKFAGGELNATTLSAQVPCLYSGLTALFLPGLLSVIISLVYKPYKYDWNKFKEAQLVIASEEARTSQDDSTSNESINQKYDEKNNNYSVNESPQKEAELESLGSAEKTDKLLKKYTRLAAIAFVVTLLVTWVIWPFAMYRDWIMTEAYYKGYIVVGLIWLYATLIVIGLFPIWEGRHAIKIIVKGLYRDYIKREKPQN